MAKKKEPDYSTATGVREWIDACGFSNDVEAAQSLGLPLRTFSRYKSKGLPHTRQASELLTQFLVDKMKDILRGKKQTQSVS